MLQCTVFCIKLYLILISKKVRKLSTSKLPSKVEYLLYVVQHETFDPILLLVHFT